MEKNLRITSTIGKKSNTFGAPRKVVTATPSKISADDLLTLVPLLFRKILSGNELSELTSRAAWFKWYFCEGLDKSPLLSSRPPIRMTMITN